MPVIYFLWRCLLWSLVSYYFIDLWYEVYGPPNFLSDFMFAVFLIAVPLAIITLSLKPLSELFRD